MPSKSIRNVAKALHAGTPLGTRHLMVFVPSRDRFGRRVGSRKWTRETLRALGTLFRGATAYPEGLGVWRDDQAGGKLIFDETTIVFTYVAPEALTEDALAELRAFLQRMGRETNQGEVGLVFEGHYIGITDYGGPSHGR